MSEYGNCAGEWLEGKETWCLMLGVVVRKSAVGFFLSTAEWVDALAFAKGSVMNSLFFWGLISVESQRRNILTPSPARDAKLVPWDRGGLGRGGLRKRFLRRLRKGLTPSQPPLASRARGKATLAGTRR
jgi:hypothetical protein